MEIILDEHRARRDAARWRLLIGTAVSAALVGGLLGVVGAVAGGRVASRDADRDRRADQRIAADAAALQVVDSLPGDLREYEVGVAAGDRVVRAVVRSRLADRRTELRAAMARAQVVGSPAVARRLGAIDATLTRALLARTAAEVRSARSQLARDTASLEAEARASAG
ncbi:MAG: hypothetical protein HYX34_01760 [Actinobacteria bacterium]|nr:hypothetical protein [Actinomycetota bacterium]